MSMHTFRGFRFSFAARADGAQRVRGTALHADRCGFCEEASFAKLFQTATGLCPKRYRGGGNSGVMRRRPEDLRPYLLPFKLSFASDASRRHRVNPRSSSGLGGCRSDWARGHFACSLDPPIRRQECLRSMPTHRSVRLDPERGHSCPQVVCSRQSGRAARDSRKMVAG